MNTLKYILPVLVLLIGCKNKEINDTVVELDPSNYKRNVDYKSIFRHVEILPIKSDLDSAIWFGEISQYKSYKNNIYLLDENQSKSITGIDQQGNVKFQFRNVGDGEGEYKAIYAFTVNIKRDQLIIYERYKKQLMIYELDDFTFIKTIKLQEYLSNIEFWKGDEILCFVEGDTFDENTMIYSLDLKTEERHSLFRTKYIGIKLDLLPSCYNYSQQILALPFKEEIWKWDSEHEEFILDTSIKINDQEFPDRLLMNEDVLEQEDFYLGREYLFYLNNYAEINSIGYGFFYLDYDEKVLFRYDRSTNEIKLFNWLDLYQNESMPLPNNFYKGEYLAISYLNSDTYKELVQEFPQKNSSILNASSSSIEQAYLFKYKLK